MKGHKTVAQKFIWSPVEPSSFGVPPRKPELRTPVFWLVRDDFELYFVNSSEETLERVIARSGGFQTLDEQVLTVSNKNGYEYKNVSPQVAVKVDEYDPFLDSDYMLQVSLRIESAQLGCVEIATLPEKGGVGGMVLLWNTGEYAKQLSVRNGCLD